MPPATALHPRSADSSGEAGFTLIEVIAVLVIAALLAGALAFVARPTGGAAQLKALAGTIAAGLRHTRGRAIKRGRELVTRIDIGKPRIEWGTKRPALNIRRGIAIKVTSAKSEGSGTLAGIRFFPNGSSTGGRVELSSRGVRYDVAVNWLTGRVTVEQRQ